MTSGEKLLVRVNEELVLDAGACEIVSGPQGPERVIHPPETTLFHQVLAYLQAKTDPSRPPSGSRIGREGVAAAAVALRWGSYLAVLADSARPVWPYAVRQGISRIDDSEMARINIEASAALAEWVDLYRAQSGEGLYARLVDRAVAYLPMPQKTSRRHRGHIFEGLALPEIAASLIQANDASRLTRARANAEGFPSRLFANALANVAWRNGPVESLHAGAFRGYPLNERRITEREERELFRFTVDRMAMGMMVTFRLAMEGSARSWSEKVLPYGLAELACVTPSGWGSGHIRALNYSKNPLNTFPTAPLP